MPRRLTPVLALFVAVISAGSAAAQNGSGDDPPQGPSGPPPGGDPIAWVLATLELDEEALGVHPRGHHTRFPLPGDMPHTLPFFADLWAEPLRTYEWAADMARYSRTYLDPAYLAGVGASWPGDMEATDQPRPDAAYHLLFHLGICRLTTRFRDYSVNLTPRTFDDRPLVEAVAELRELGGIGTSLVTFGRDADFPRPRDEAERAAEGIDPELQQIVATAMLDLADARRWIDLAFRNVDWDDRLAVWRILDLSEIQLDGLRYDPAVDDVIAALDRESLLYGGMKAVRITEELRARLRAWQAAHPRASAGVDYEQMTPYGRVVIAGSGNDLHTCTDCMLLIDLGGNDTYEMAVGAPPDPDLPLAVAVDMAGKDEYRPAPFGLPTQGAGAMGVGILWDVAGDDHYSADGPLAQGVAQVGVGLLMDEAGDDVFQAATAAQGAAFFGVGMLVDIEGADHFTCHGECQGFGGSGGAGALVNGRGDDVYIAEVMPDVVYRPDYHAGMERNITSAQGVGLGRRGDGGDGHSWAGGLGVLLDAGGDDRYEAGTFSQGCGYWFGTGVLYEGGGDDVYESVNFSHGSGAHFCIGAVIDEQGNDEHKAVHTGTCALGFGWDYTNALMFDRQGDDLYVGHEAVLGVANGRSNALAIDLAGDDRYELSGTGDAFGQAGVMPQIDHRDPSRPYFHDGTSLGLFLDADGGDSYLRAGQPDPVAADAFFTLSPAPGDPRYELLNFGVGLDASGGVPAAFTLPPEE